MNIIIGKRPHELDSNSVGIQNEHEFIEETKKIVAKRRI
jgi:hypothetical protein